MQSFPKPLSAKEEKECIARCRAGDLEARNCLIEKNLRLVAYIAKKYNMVYNQYKKAACLVRQVSVYTAMCKEPEGMAAIPALHRQTEI